MSRSCARPSAVWFAGLALIASIAPGEAAPRVLTFEDRVKAQDAIERVYYAHQVDARMPFEQAVPRALLEQKVRTYLKQSAALNRFWNTPITASMLQAELDRIAGRTRMPDRLRELYGALGNDPILILECLARPALASRLARNFFSGDSSDWDVWWQNTAGTLNESTVGTVADQSAVLPAPAAAQPCANDVWNNGSLDDPLSARDTHTAVWTGSRMIVWGGGGSVFPSTGAAYDPVTDTWTPTSIVNAPSERYRHSAVWTGSRMLIWGGLSGSNDLNTGAQYDPVADVWTPISTANAPAARELHNAVWTGTSMIVWGGEQFSTGTFTNTGGRYDPANDSWLPTSLINAPSARYDASAVWTGTEMIVWAGTGSINPANTGGRYNPATDTWAPTSTIGAPVGTVSPSAVWTGSRMVVWGGSNQQTGGRYDPAADTWQPTTTVNAPSARSDQTAVWTGTRMIIWGGDSGSPVTTGALYDPVVDSWSAASTVNAPIPVHAHTAVWTGSQMIVWGGDTPNGPSNFGGRYDPASNSWTPVNYGGGLPYGHNDALAVWTGNLMVVWGGTDANNVFLKTGGRYDPLLDAWTPTSTLNAAASLMSQSVVWTGTEMIVWGGSLLNGQSGFTNAGQRYNPTSDAWTATTTLGAPSARNSHAAVWTGSRMVIWGGFFTPFNGGPLSYPADGGLYDPSNNTWTGTTTTGAPTGRSGPRAVWNGSQMLVWGGNNAFAGGYLGTGGRYDPAANAWTPITTANAPAGRLYFVSSWAGDRMVVWGGQGSGTIDQGGRYDPLLDSWSPITLVGAPALRTQSQAVSTGREMIVWGGSSSLGATQVGWRYDAVADSWAPTSLLNAPYNVNNMSVVWTGESMLVWGGNYLGGTSQPLNLGGRYCACTNTTYYADADGDGIGNSNASAGFCSQPAGYVLTGGDCNDGDATSWQTPSEAQNLMSPDQGSLAWQAPANPGGTALLYDVIRSTSRSDYVTSADCVATNTPGTAASDGSTPPPGGIFYYLVRAEDGCVPGEGSLGTDSNGTPRTARHCP